MSIPTKEQMERALAEDRLRENRAESDAQDLRREKTALLFEIEALKKERDELQSWKESMVQVEREWDLQELARILNLPLGSNIRSSLGPAVIKLLKERDRARTELEMANNDRAHEQSRAEAAEKERDQLQAVAGQVLEMGFQLQDCEKQRDEAQAKLANSEMLRNGAYESCEVLRLRAEASEAKLAKAEAALDVWIARANEAVLERHQARDEVYHLKGKLAKAEACCGEMRTRFRRLCDAAELFSPGPCSDEEYLQVDKGEFAALRFEKELANVYLGQPSSSCGQGFIDAREVRELVQPTIEFLRTIKGLDSGDASMHRRRLEAALETLTKGSQ